MQVNYGTGTSPTAGSAVSGTQASPVASMTAAVASTNEAITLFAVVTGLSVGTAYWIDVAFAAVTAGTASVQVKGAIVVEF